MKEIITMRNFLLVLERRSLNNHKSLLIRTSGYTSTEEAVRQSWVRTQLRTLPHSNRSQLPDPVIAPQSSIATNLYEELDCTIYNLYFLPACKGLKYAIEEAGEFFEREIFPEYEKLNLLGHSKGGLFMGALTKELDTKTNLVMVSPTFGTIMGAEENVFSELEQYKNKQSPIKKLFLTPEIGGYKMITRLFGSRRPIDYDMAINSEFMKKDLDLSKLKNHRTMLVTATCPNGICNPVDATFRHYGKFLNLDKKADGMVSLENQRLPMAYEIDKLLELTATHPTVLKKAIPSIVDFFKN